MTERRNGDPPAQRRILYGRRAGHRLRKGQQRLLDTLLPSLSFDLPDAATLQPADLFDRPVAEIWLEIGFGGGEHLAAQAAAHRDIGFIGCEPFINGVAKLLAAVERDRLDNIRLYTDDARAVLRALAPASIGRAFILFPDPWPKTRHHKRRIVNPAVLDDLARLMPPGSELRIATDDPGYLDWILFHAGHHSGFRWAARSPSDWRERPDDWPETRYEQKAIAAGRVPAFLSYRRGD